MAIDAKVIEQLKTKHGEIFRLDWKVDGKIVAEILVKRPGKHDYRKFRGETLNESKRADAPEGFIRGCCVHPSQEELTSILEKLPGLVDTWTNGLVDLAGVAKDCEAIPI